MRSNEAFLEVIRNSFKEYLFAGTSRSTKKIKPLHGAISEDLQSLYGDEYQIISQGYGEGREKSVDGRYYSKKVDITVCKEDIPVAGYAVKFVMSNYPQNSVNYFENMLGETANIRTNSIPFFQIFILFDILPYYKKNGVLEKYDKVTIHNIEKYIKLSEDDPGIFFHTPDKTLIILVHLKEPKEEFDCKNLKEYIEYYTSVIGDCDLLSYSTQVPDEFGNSVILNDYDDYLQRTYHIVHGKSKRKSTDK